MFWSYFTVTHKENGKSNTDKDMCCSQTLISWASFHTKLASRYSLEIVQTYNTMKTLVIRTRVS